MIFTDGPCELDDDGGVWAGCGAVVHDPEAGTLEVFGNRVGDELAAILTSNGAKRQIVGQAELLPCVAADEVRNRNVRWYLDNEAARYGRIKGASPTRDSAKLIQELCMDGELACQSWIERAPIASNCADKLSRGQWDILGACGLSCARCL